MLKKVKPYHPYDSKLEKERAECLEMLKRGEEILDWRHHPFSIRLAKNTYYTPDFLVVHRGGETGHHLLTLEEVKGSWKAKSSGRDQRTKIKIASEMFPWFSFVGVTKVCGKWVEEQFG